jgi:mRNA interferase RelE/StbE
MSYELAIDPLAEREWGRLDGAVRKRFKQKLLTERLLVPRVAKDALHGSADTYKIKITSPQYRLAYHVDDQALVLTILAISTSDDVYELLKSRK